MQCKDKKINKLTLQSMEFQSVHGSSPCGDTKKKHLEAYSDQVLFHLRPTITKAFHPV